jgi:hypothetical protein
MKYMNIQLIEKMALLISISLNVIAVAMLKGINTKIESLQTELHGADLRIKDLTQKLNESAEKAAALNNEEVLKIQNEL